LAVSELIANNDFSSVTDGMPDDWRVVCPNQSLAPVFRAGESRGLTARGNGRVECFGYVCQTVSLEGGKTYQMQVRLRTGGLGDVNRHLVHGVFGEGFNDGIFSYKRQGDWIVGENRFPGPQKDVKAEMRLYFRFSPDGCVYWDSVSLRECDPIPRRPTKIACSQGRGSMEHWARWLDRAGEKNVDVALLPEMFNGKGVKDAEPINGPAGTLMASKARQWKMYVSGSFYERRGDLVYNTAPLFDRSGELTGSYCKNQLYDPELDEGATPGTGFHVFDADFGRVGIIICYDSWFPETVRILAYKGAELILFPNAGYFAGLMPARAADNGVWIGVSSLGGPAGVWDSGGARAGEMYPENTRHCRSSVLAYEEDRELGMVVATIDLSRKYSPHWWGGPMRSAPGGRHCRQTLIEPVEEQIAREVRRWWDE